MPPRLNDYSTEPFEDLQTINGIEFPAEMKFRQLLVTGPPGSGKSTIIKKIRGWPEEGYIDLSMNKWWKMRTLSMRPREIHLGLPCIGHEAALAVFDDDWKHASPPPELDTSRIKIPPRKRFFFSTNWQGRYYFEFLLPSFKILYERRKERKKRGTHHVDDYVNPALVKNHLDVFQRVAVYLFEQGLKVYIRESVEKPPMQIKLDRA